MKLLTFLLYTGGLFLVSLCSNVLYAQSEKECSNILKQVIEAYENKGTIDAIANREPLAPCITNHTFATKNDRLNALKYMILIYLYVNENEKARNYMQSFMKTKLKSDPYYDPRFESPEAGVPEFIELYNQLRSWPIFFYGLRVGGNLAQIETTKNFNVDRSSVEDWEYSSILGYQAGVAFEFPFGGLKRSFSLMPELYIKQVAYEYQDLILDFATLKMEEKQTRIEFPLLLKYHLKRQGSRNKSIENNDGGQMNLKIQNKIQPFIQIGGSFEYLLSSNADFNRVDAISNDEGAGGSRDPITQSFNLVNTEQRERINLQAIVGGGFRFRNFMKSGGDLTLEGRFYYGINNQVRVANRGSDIDQIYRFGYIDDDFKLHQITFSIAYMFPKYDPKPIPNAGLSFSDNKKKKKKKDKD